jgi:hypothetical protein
VSEPVPTRHEMPDRPASAPPASATRREQDDAGIPPTRRESPGNAGAAALAPGVLPPSLRDRLADAAPMPAQGGEADCSGCATLARGSSPKSRACG